MHADAHAERYVRLGLQLGRHADDVVDTYFGPPELAVAVGVPEAFACVAEAGGIEIDLPRAVAVESALETCRWAEVNAALMLYEDGTGEDEVRAYLEHWGVLDAELSVHVMRFLGGRRSRGYIINYAAGRELCAVGRDPARYRRLLSEQVRVGELKATAP